METRTPMLQEVGAAFRDHGTTAAITALIGGTIALLGSVTRKAFTNDAIRDMIAPRWKRYLRRQCLICCKKSKQKKAGSPRFRMIRRERYTGKVST